MSVDMDVPGFPAQVVQWDRHSPLSPIHVPDLQVSPRLPVSVSSSSGRSDVGSQGSFPVRMSDLCLSAPPSYSAVTRA